MIGDVADRKTAGRLSIKRSRALGEIDLTSVSEPAQGFSSEPAYGRISQSGANQTREDEKHRNEAKQGCLPKDLAVCREYV